MKVKIKIDCLGSENGYVIQNFKAGMEYDITDKLAKSFIERGLALDSSLAIEEDTKKVAPKETKKEEVIEENEVAKEEDKEEEIEEKMNNSYENKAIKSPKKNKGRLSKIAKKLKIKKGKK